jgi:hypothetical protein
VAADVGERQGPLIPRCHHSVWTVLAASEFGFFDLSQSSLGFSERVPASGCLLPHYRPIASLRWPNVLFRDCPRCRLSGEYGDVYLATCRKFVSVLFRRRYRPELHYMRGPGPKWLERHGKSSIQASRRVGRGHSDRSAQTAVRTLARTHRAWAFRSRRFTASLRGSCRSVILWLHESQGGAIPREGGGMRAHGRAGERPRCESFLRRGGAPMARVSKTTKTIGARPRRVATISVANGRSPMGGSGEARGRRRAPYPLRRVDSLSDQRVRAQDRRAGWRRRGRARGKAH